MQNRKSKMLKARWERLCKNISKKGSPFAGLSKEQVINALRKTREKLWEEKLATRT
jgi:hypothetical protein